MVLVEPLLDPAVEAQALGRVNRIGQSRDTWVHRFVARAPPCTRRRPVVRQMARCCRRAAAHYLLHVRRSPGHVLRKCPKAHAGAHARDPGHRHGGHACSQVSASVEENVHRLCAARAIAMDLSGAAPRRSEAPLSVRCAAAHIDSHRPPHCACQSKCQSALSGVLMLSITLKSKLENYLLAQRRRSTAGPELDRAGGQQRTRRE